jgi:aconitate hydratase
MNPIAAYALFNGSTGLIDAKNQAENVTEIGLGQVQSARIIALFGDSITTDHISPAGAIDEHSPAGQWLLARGVKQADFNSYGARRGHHEVMMRGTFANVRIKNLMLPAGPDGSRTEGGLTLHQPTGDSLSIFEAAQRYLQNGEATVVLAGEEYGTGSSRDWAAKGTQLLGIKAVVARSFERIHRSNLVGMGVLPLQFKGADSWETLGLKGDEFIDILPHPALKPQSDARMHITYDDGSEKDVLLTLRIDTPIEVDYYRSGGILPYVLRQLLA